MEPEENKRSIRHIRLPVEECTGERGVYWKRKSPVEVPGRDYTDSVREILQSSFTVEGKQFNIFKITLVVKPTPSEIDKIFNWFKAQPAFYFSPHDILLKSLS